MIRVAYRLFTRAVEERITRHGVSIGMWFFLRELWREDGLTQAELSDRVGVVGPTTVTAMDRMQRMGLIERRKSGVDRRNTHIFLTPRGRELEEALVPAAQDVFQHSQSKLTPKEQEQLRQLLGKVLSALYELDGTGGEGA